VKTGRSKKDRSEEEKIEREESKMMIDVYGEGKKVVAKVDYIFVGDNVIARFLDDKLKVDCFGGRNFELVTLSKNNYLSELRNGYILIHSDKRFGEIISKEQALNEIIKSGKIKLLERKRFEELKA